MAVFGPISASAALKSVLMIAVDDLRPQLSIYPEGGEVMHTPNFERLANRTVVFERAYVQVALCMPSRTSLLTSRRPDTSRSWTIEADQWFRLSGGNFTTLPQRFRQEGYLTLGMGKIFHETMPSSDPQDYVLSWSPEAVFPDGGQRGKGGLYDPPGKGGKLGGAGNLAHKFPDDLEGQLQDGNITNHAVKVIADMASGKYGEDVASMKRPFFLAVGFHKPHIPWWAPARFWDLYPLEKVPPTPHPGLPTRCVNASLQDWQALTACNENDMKSICEPLTKEYPLDNTTFPIAAQLYQRQAYFASVSWTDANIGKVLDAFDNTPFAKDAVLAFWGDHGWHLGDNDIWEKMTNYEHGTKIPMMIGCAGGGCVGRSSVIVEAIDIMPTLLEEAGIPIETCPDSANQSRSTTLCTEGRSLSSILRNPAATDDSSVAFSQFPRPEHPGNAIDLSCRDNPKTQHSCTQGKCLDGCPNKMGYTMRTNNYRYTLWVGFNKCSNNTCPDGLADWDTTYGEELYNHSNSPVIKDYNVETDNIASLPGSSLVVKELRAQLIAFNTKRLMKIANKD